MRKRTGWARYVRAFLCAVLLLAAPAVARAQAAGEPQPNARAILLRMAEFLAKAQRLSVTGRVAYDALQASGQKIEWNEVRRVTISRPDRLRMEAERDDGARSLVLFDGKEITTYDEPSRVYAQAPQPGSVDDTLVYFVRDLGLRLPLAVLFVSRAPAELERRVKSVEYVQKTGIFGTPAHHIAGRTDTVDFQVWIADGDQPLPLRAVPVYKTAPGQPQFRAQLSEWNLAAEPPDSLFMFTPPADANRIPFAAAVPQIAPGSQRASAKKGARQ